MNNQTTNLLGLTRRNMETFFVDIGERSFRASQVMKWIYHADVDDFSAMTNLSKVFRGRLTEIMEIRAPEIMGKQVSRDGTTKWLMRLDGGDCVETVFIPEENRGTLCVSSQVGCALDCTFCATARQGFNRNLTVAEIVGQVYLARKELSGEGGKHGVITNVVLMGMGEPLLNFEPVAQAMELIMDDLAMGLARKRVTLSTAGVVPAIDRLRERCPVSLAVSLHAPTDELRNRLVPLNRKYPLGSLIDACKRYSVSGPKPQVTFEYIMLGGINDGFCDERELARMLKRVPAKVLLIPINPLPVVCYA
ncbi:MAG: 23S rRNA (adenine(2503)-C(2))-methyltransferase RlmN, partial [Gammaproteobacteria bacterium]|nr:23S rRNA (adenine(2503)-C(2))-methyltransferase RlmN [Gammaproteobacteria bacterium]